MQARYVIVFLLLLPVVSAVQANVTVDFSSSVGVVNDYFYGANTHGSWGSNSTWIDINDSGGRTSRQSDYQWHRDKMDEAGVMFLRIDVGLEPAGYFNRANAQKNMYRWAYLTGRKVLAIASYMPSDLANMSELCCATYPDCSVSRYYDYSRCPPLDYDAYARRTVEYLDVVTENGTYADAVEVEVWNEPDIGFWLPQVPRNDVRRSEYYNMMYDAIQREVKLKYPNMPVGGPGLADVRSPMFASFIGNFSGRFDFLSYHRYNPTNNANYGLNMGYDLAWARGMCTSMNVSCPLFYIDEWNEWSADVKVNNTVLWRAHLYEAYMWILNKAPESVMAMYQWSDWVKYNSTYANGTYKQAEYPHHWNMVSEPQLDNATFASFDVTKVMSTYHRGGSQVALTNVSSTQVAVLGTYGFMGRFLTVVDTMNYSIDVNIELKDVNNDVLRDVLTGDEFAIVGGNVSMTLSPYEVRTFELSSSFMPMNFMLLSYGVDENNVYVGYTEADLKNIVADGVGTFMASVVDVIDLVVIGFVLLAVVVLVTRFSKKH